MASRISPRYIKPTASKYTQSQLANYLDVIGYNEIPQSSTELTLLNLTRITRLHQVSFPFENTEMHFRLDGGTDVSSEGVFERLVLHHQGGAFCLGLNNMLLNMLSAFGFRGYPVLARVNRVMGSPGETPVFKHASHMILLVQVEDRPGETYIVDGAFGGDGIVRPLLFFDGSEDDGSTSFERYRVVKSAYSPGSSDGATAWLMEMSKGIYTPGAPRTWTALFSFTEAECFHDDVENVVWVDTQMRLSNWRKHIICVHFFVTEETAHLPIEDATFGKYMMYRRAVTKSIGSKSEVVKELKCEEDRVQALRKYFNIYIPKDQVRNIDRSLGSFAQYLGSKVHSTSSITSAFAKPETKAGQTLARL